MVVPFSCQGLFSIIYVLIRNFWAEIWTITPYKCFVIQWWCMPNCRTPAAAINGKTVWDVKAIFGFEEWPKIVFILLTAIYTSNQMECSVDSWIKIKITIVLMMMTAHITIYQTQFQHFNDFMSSVSSTQPNKLHFILVSLSLSILYFLFLWMKEINGYFNQMKQNDDYTTICLWD